MSVTRAASAEAPGLKSCNKGITWFDLVFDRDLLPRHIERLKAGDKGPPSHHQIVTLLLNNVTKGQYGLPLRQYSISAVHGLLHGHAIPGSAGTEAVYINERGKKLVELASSVALALEYDLKEVRKHPPHQQVLLLAGMWRHAAPEARGRVECLCHRWVMGRSVQPSSNPSNSEEGELVRLAPESAPRGDADALVRVVPEGGSLFAGATPSQEQLNSVRFLQDLISGPTDALLDLCVAPSQRDSAPAAALRVCVECIQFSLASARFAEALQMAGRAHDLAAELATRFERGSLPSPGAEAAAAPDRGAAGALSAVEEVPMLVHRIHGLASCCLMQQLATGASSCEGAGEQGPHSASSEGDADGGPAIVARCLAVPRSALEGVRFRTWPLCLQAATLLSAAKRRGDCTLALAAAALDLCCLCARSTRAGEPPAADVSLLERESYLTLATASADASSPLHAGQQAFLMASNLRACIVSGTDAPFADSLTWLLSTRLNNADTPAALEPHAADMDHGTFGVALWNDPAALAASPLPSAVAEGGSDGLWRNVERNCGLFRGVMKGEGPSELRALACLSVLIQLCWTAAVTAATSEHDAEGLLPLDAPTRASQCLLQLVASISNACLHPSLASVRRHFHSLLSFMTAPNPSPPMACPDAARPDEFTLKAPSEPPPDVEMATEADVTTSTATHQSPSALSSEQAAPGDTQTLLTPPESTEWAASSKSAGLLSLLEACAQGDVSRVTQHAEALGEEERATALRHALRVAVEERESCGLPALELPRDRAAAADASAASCVLATSCVLAIEAASARAYERGGEQAEALRAAQGVDGAWIQAVDGVVGGTRSLFAAPLPSTPPSRAAMTHLAAQLLAFRRTTDLQQLSDMWQVMMAPSAIEIASRGGAAKAGVGREVEEDAEDEVADVQGKAETPEGGGPMDIDERVPTQQLPSSGQSSRASVAKDWRVANAVCCCCRLVNAAASLLHANWSTERLPRVTPSSAGAALSHGGQAASESGPDSDRATANPAHSQLLALIGALSESLEKDLARSHPWRQGGGGAGRPPADKASHADVLEMHSALETVNAMISVLTAAANMSRNVRGAARAASQPNGGANLKGAGGDRANSFAPFEEGQHGMLLCAMLAAAVQERVAVAGFRKFRLDLNKLHASVPAVPSSVEAAFRSWDNTGQTAAPRAAYANRLLGVALFDLLLRTLTLVSAVPPPTGTQLLEAAFKEGPFPPREPRAPACHAALCLQTRGELLIALKQLAPALECYVHSALALREVAADEGDLARILTSRHFSDLALHNMCDCLVNGERPRRLPAAVLLQCAKVPDVSAAIKLLKPTGPAGALLLTMDLAFAACIWEVSLLEALMFVMEEAHAGKEGVQMLSKLMANPQINSHNHEGLRKQYAAQCRIRLLELLPGLLS